MHIDKDDEVIEKILAGKIDDISGDSDADLAATVEKLKAGLLSIEDEDPPQLTLYKNQNHKEKKSGIAWVQDMTWEWYRNPFVLSFGFLAFVFFLYILIVFVFV